MQTARGEQRILSLITAVTFANVTRQLFVAGADLLVALPAVANICLNAERSTFSLAHRWAHPTDPCALCAFGRINRISTYFNTQSLFSLFSVMSSPAPKVVGYFTDVEGNWEYFQSCLALSSVLQVIIHHCHFCCVHNFRVSVPL